jgi:hypothetical protein
MPKTVTTPMVPAPNRGSVPLQFPNPYGGPMRIPYPNPST